MERLGKDPASAIQGSLQIHGPARQAGTPPLDYFAEERCHGVASGTHCQTWLHGNHPPSPDLLWVLIRGESAVIAMLRSQSDCALFREVHAL